MHKCALTADQLMIHHKGVLYTLRCIPSSNVIRILTVGGAKPPRNNNVDQFLKTIIIDFGLNIPLTYKNFHTKSIDEIGREVVVALSKIVSQ